MSPCSPPGWSTNVPPIRPRSDRARAMKAIFGFFRKRWVLTLLGLILLSLLIWFVGPLFAFAEYKPLDPQSRRWILIGLVFAIWLARLAWGWIKQLRANRSLLSGLVGSGQTDQPSEGQRA